MPNGGNAEVVLSTPGETHSMQTPRWTDGTYRAETSKRVCPDCLHLTISLSVVLTAHVRRYTRMKVRNIDRHEDKYKAFVQVVGWSPRGDASVYATGILSNSHPLAFVV